jgi:hypothetical protein
MRIAVVIALLSVLHVIAEAQKWHSTQTYSHIKATIPTTASFSTVAQRDRRDDGEESEGTTTLPGKVVGSSTSEVQKRSAEKSVEAQEMPEEAPEPVEIPEDDGTESTMEKRETTITSPDARLKKRQVEQEKDIPKTVEKREEEPTTTPLAGLESATSVVMSARRRRQADTSDEEAKREKRQEPPIMTPPTSTVSYVTPVHEKRHVHEQVVTPTATNEMVNKRGSENEKENGEPEQPIETANNDESPTRMRRGSGHKNRPSTVSRMSSGSNTDSKTQTTEQSNA